MALRKLFITGGTGYIGGSVLDKIVQQHPELQITALLRSPTPNFKFRFPDVKILIGTFDDFDVVKGGAENADIVIHTGDIDHPGCAAAILAGLSRKTTPSFLIHLTGTGCISDEREQTWEGKSNPRIWNDVEDINDIYHLPPSAKHHAIDVDIMDASNDLLKTASICPPDIYGLGTGPSNATTFMVPEYIKVITKENVAWYLGKGGNYRAVVHILDVVDLFILLLEEALKGGGKAQWGKEGFYFAVSDEVKWIDAAVAINKLGVEQGWLPKESKPVSWTKEQVDALLPGLPGLALYIWGSNSRAESARAKALGWKPQHPTFWEALNEEVAVALHNLEAPMGKLVAIPTRKRH